MTGRLWRNPKGLFYTYNPYDPTAYLRKHPLRIVGVDSNGKVQLDDNGRTIVANAGDQAGTATAPQHNNAQHNNAQQNNTQQQGLDFFDKLALDNVDNWLSSNDYSSGIMQSATDQYDSTSITEAFKARGYYDPDTGGINAVRVREIANKGGWRPGYAQEGEYNQSANADNSYYQASSFSEALGEAVNTPGQNNIFDVLPKTEQERFADCGKVLAESLDKAREAYLNNLDGFNRNTQIVVSKMPDVLKLLGLKGRKLTIANKDLLGISKTAPNSILNGQSTGAVANTLHTPHGINKHLLKQLPEALCDPEIIYESVSENFDRENQSRICAVVELEEQGGNKGLYLVAIVASDKNGQAANKKKNLVTSIYKVNYKQVETQLNKPISTEDGVAYPKPLYIKNSSTFGAVSLRIQSPSRLHQHSAAIRDRIAQKYSAVNRGQAGSSQAYYQEGEPNYDPSIEGQRQEMTAKIQQGENVLFQEKTATTKGFFNPTEGIIGLFKGADASTVIHEGGHFFVENLINDVLSGDCTQQQQQDAAALMDYCGITLEQWQSMSVEERRQHHEKLADEKATA